MKVEPFDGKDYPSQAGLYGYFRLHDKITGMKVDRVYEGFTSEADREKDHQLAHDLLAQYRKQSGVVQPLAPLSELR